MHGVRAAFDVFIDKKKPPERGRLFHLRVVHRLERLSLAACAAVVVDDLVERALHQGVADNAEAEEGEDEVDDGDVRVHRHAAALLRDDDGLSHLVEPVEAVDAAGDEGEEDDHTARGRRAFARRRMCVFRERINPVDGIEANGDEGEYDGEGKAFLCHKKHPFFLRVQRVPPLS